MQSEWESKLIEEIDFVIGDGNYSSKYPKGSEFKTIGIPFFSASDINNGRLTLNNVRYITAELHSSLKKGHIKKDDVLIVTRGNGCGGTALVDSKFEDSNINAQLVFIRECQEVNGKYLYYYMYQMNKSGYIQGFITGSAQPQLPIKNIKKIPIVIPPLSTQKKIAHILSTLDDKIELSRNMNETLEAMAQAMFKSWFVNFDPVHAKATAKNEAALDQAGKTLGISQEILDLFPSKFVESEMGMIPRGWEVKALYDTAEYVNGATFKAKDFSDNKTGLPIIKIVELKNGISNATSFTTSSHKSKYLINNGDVLYSWSGSPETSLDLFKWFGGEGWLNQHIFKLNFTSDNQKFFTYYLLKVIKPLLIRTAQQKQTTGLGHITVADMKRIKVAYPDSLTLNEFAKYTKPIYEQSSLVMQQVETLKHARNTLLPKLLSGELDVSELEIN